jgi:S1-C subfamily serine protease
MNAEIPPDPSSSTGVAPLDPQPAEVAAPMGPTPVAQAPITPRRDTGNAAPPRGGRILPMMLAASMLSAVLASGVTATAVLWADNGASASAAPTTGATAASAKTPVTIGSTDAVVQVAAATSPAVVTITSQGTTQGFGPFSVPSTGVGSGFIFQSNGLILTNYHVVQGADQLTVTLQDGTELAGTVVATDQTHDLAVVKVAGTDLPTVPLGSSAGLKVGQLVVAIGSPLGTFTETVTSGILSGTGRTITVASAGSRDGQTLTDLLQTDAAINEGNSGGPLLDAAGQVVGINTAVASSAQGIGFATPIDIAAAVIAQARTASAAPS